MTVSDSIKGKVLIVDDQLENLNLLFLYLAEAGHEVVAAQRGETALEQAKFAQPDIILLDVMMPGIDGFETCRRLKEDETTQEIPVIFMTALSDVDHKIRGFESGAVDYVTKPLKYQEILARVNTHLSIRRLQQELQAEIVERRKAEAKLQTRNQELDAFARTVAHDLKNPLHALTSIAEVLFFEHQQLSSEAMKRYLWSIVQSGKKASSIIESLLVLAGVRQKEVKVNPLDMDALVAEVLQHLAPIIEESQAHIILPTRFPPAMGYAPWVEEVWMNYLSNAIKYGGQPPRVELGATILDDQRVRFWVQDNGPGLTSEEQKRLFVPFERLSQVNVKGYGLGLSIVYSIMEKLGGQVEVQSEGIPGQGSTFSFILPII